MNVDFDLAIHFDQDFRAIRSLLQLERSIHINPHAMVKVPLLLQNRQRLVDWMGKVCREEGADLNVFPLAVQLLDRFLCVQPTAPGQLQALGSGCLLLASKLKAPKPMTVHRLCYYTADRLDPDVIRVSCARAMSRVSISLFQHAEELVLSKLDWNLSTPTAFEFFDHVLCSEEELNSVRDEFNDHLTFILQGWLPFPPFFGPVPNLRRR